jgi:hypothetical protein
MKTKAAGMVLLLAVSSGAGLVGQVPTFPTETRRVTVDVVVTDEKGQPIPALKAEDFVVGAAACRGTGMICSPSCRP